MKGFMRKMKLGLYAKNYVMPILGVSSWRPAKSLVKLRQQVDAAWPNRRADSDGTIGDDAHKTRDSDHNPWVIDGSLGVVTAIDITHDPSNGCDANLIVNAIVKSRDRRIKYIIWNRKILSSIVHPWEWRNYTGKNSHTKHFHLSVLPEKDTYDDSAPWELR